MPPSARPIDYRPMTEQDIEAHLAIATRAFDALGAQQGTLDPFGHPPPPSAPAAARTRRHLLITDPDGAWVAEDGAGEVVGAAVAIVREDVWGLSSLVVEPELQSAGVGSELLRRALAYGDGGRRGALIVASSDPRALRAYGRAGFALRPTIKASGPVGAERLPASPGWIEPARAAHGEAMAATSRALRGASHAPDMPMIRATGELHVAAGGERGFVWHDRGVVKLLAARDEEAARALLWRALAGTPAGTPVHLGFVSGEQQWAIAAALEAGLRLTVEGAVCVRGAPGPLCPYVPNGSFL